MRVTLAALNHSRDRLLVARGAFAALVILPPNGSVDLYRAAEKPFRSVDGLRMR